MVRHSTLYGVVSMTKAFREIYTKHDFHMPDETNLLTKVLTEQGCNPADYSTWPTDVYSEDGKHFLYRWDWKFAKIWEAPCGLQHKGHGQWWGEIHAEGIYFCNENDNPLFECPYPAKPCPYRKENFPKGINCSFRQVSTYDEAKEIDGILRARCNRIATVTEKEIQDHPGYEHRCGGMKIETDAEGNELIRYSCQKDMLADLQAIRDGVEVIHESDKQKAAQQKKSNSRRRSEIERQARKIANGTDEQRIRTKYIPKASDSDAVRKRKEETWEAITAKYTEITNKKEKRKPTGEQISFFDGR